MTTTEVITYTTEELAERLGVGSTTLRDWRYNGTGPPAYRIGRRYRYLASDVIEWMRTQPVSSPAPRNGVRFGQNVNTSAVPDPVPPTDTV